MPLEGATLASALAVAPVVVGAVLALGGLFLALRRGRVVGLATLAVGAVLVALPRLVLPPTPPGALGAHALAEGLAIAVEGGRTVAAPAAVKPPPLPGRPATVIAIEASEVEPNDTLAGANLTVGNASAALALTDDAGQTLGIATTFDALALRKATLERPLDAPRYYVVVRGGDAATDYHLTVAIRR